MRKASCEFKADRHIQPQRKNIGSRKSEQHPYRPHSKTSSVQSEVGGAHQELVSTATNEHARTDQQPSQQSSSARNEPSSNYKDINKNTHSKHLILGWVLCLILQGTACCQWFNDLLTLSPALKMSYDVVGESLPLCFDSPDVILCGWLGSKHHQTNFHFA